MIFKTLLFAMFGRSGVLGSNEIRKGKEREREEKK